MNLLSSSAGRRWLFALLYLSEGAPIGFVWWALPTLLASAGMELAAITALTSAATLPWVLKFLVAPVIDAGLARRIPIKRWILVCQVLMALSLLPLSLIDWPVDYSLLMLCVVLYAIFAAVQDVGIDTLAVRCVPADELGRINGFMQAGMLTGRAGVAAATALIAAFFGSPAVAIVLVAVLVFAPAIVLAFGVREPRFDAVPFNARDLLGTVATRSTFAGLAVALLIGAGFEFFGVSVGPRLVDLNYSATSVAWFYGLFAPAGLALGALAGGALSDRFGVVRGSALALTIMTLLLLVIAFDDYWPGLFGSQIVSYSMAYIAIGLLTASSYALFMTLSRGRYAATRISLFMAMTNACEAWAAYAGGRLAVQSYGYSVLVLAAIACLALLPLFALRRVDAMPRTA